MSQLVLKSQEVWPSVDAYYRFNPRFRLYGTVAGTKLDESSYSDAAIGLFADYFTFPVAKKIHPKKNHADSLPGKFLYLRAGYQYSATPTSAEDPFKESMIVTEANTRFYLPSAMLLTFKNRFDWRFNSGDFNIRYRPRLMVERDLKTEYLTFTASGFAEYYVNFGNSAVNRFKTQIGIEIRVFKNMNYEVFWNHQVANEPEIQEVDAFGMTLKIYMNKNEKIFGKKKKETMTSVKQNENFFSISDAGFISRLLKKLNLDLPLWLLVLILMCITWLPLVIMTAIDGTLISGTPLPFLKDMVIQGRVLIGIPLLLLIEKAIYQNTPAVLLYLTEMLIHVEDRENFVNGPLNQAKKSTNSNLVEIFILLLVVVVSIGNAEGASLYLDEIDAGSWLVSGSEGNQVLSFAGKWVHYISFPVFQFLLLRWVWRYITWVVLLFRISKRKLNLQPTHPDGAGGLGVLLIAQRNFSILFVVCGLVISCEMIGRLIAADNFFDPIKVEITGYIIFSVLMMLFPLFFFSSKLVQTKIQGQLDFGRAGTDLTSQFEGGFVQVREKKQTLTENRLDPSTHVDLTGVYTNLQQMRIVPIAFRDVFYLAILLFVPFIPIFFIHFSIAELLQKIMGLLV